jgi:hypothetical protein
MRNLALRGRAHSHALRRRVPVLLTVLGTVTGLVLMSAGAAFAYFTASDSSHPAAAVAATLTAATAGAQNGTGTPTSIPIKWTKPPGYSPTSYTVLRCTGSSCTPTMAVGNGTCSGPITSASCTDTDTTLVAGTTYSYAVEADLDSWVSPVSASFKASTTGGTKLTFTAQPGSGASINAAGTSAPDTFSISVAIQDPGGVTITGDNSDQVTVAIDPGHNPGPGTLTCSGGDTARVSAGVAAFTGCAIDKAGTGYELTATSSTSPSLAAPANAHSFIIAAGPSVKLAFTTQPSSGQDIQATGTGSFPVAVAVEDADGNVVTGDSGTSITLSLGTNPGGGTLSCTNAGGLTVTDVSGVASFTGCAITKAGTGYTLTAASAPSYPAPSNANSFNITAGAPDYLSFSNITVPVTGATTATCTPNTGAHTNSCTIDNLVALASFTADVTLLDQNGNLATSSSPVTVGLAATGVSVLPASVTIPAGSSTSSATFTETLSLGVGTVTATATVDSASFQATIAPGVQ